jgi:hypothetical protein
MRYEELLADADQTLPSKHERLRIAKLNSDAEPAALLSLREHWRAARLRWARSRSSGGCGRWWSSIGRAEAAFIIAN